MLRTAEIELQPGAVERRQADIHGGQDRAGPDAGDDDQGIDAEIDTSGTIDFWPLAFGNESLFLLGHSAAGMNEETSQKEGCVFQRKDVQDQRYDVRRSWRDDLGVAADDDRIRVMARMAPSPDLGF